LTGWWGADLWAKTREALWWNNTPTEARANGWPVNAGQPYLVGERWPEMIIPRSNGTVIPNGAMGNTVNINMGGVTVNSKQDADYLVDKIKRELTREMQLFKLWIA
jgi:hypothetical protein